MLEKSWQTLPETILRNATLFHTFISLSHYASLTILSCLSDAIMLSNEARLEKSHREGERTHTTLNLMHYPKTVTDANVGQNKHTDCESLALILCDRWGLQVLSPETKTWVSFRRDGTSTSETHCVS
jgi:isopenicillin N synthase-like dioxygenase